MKQIALLIIFINFRGPPTGREHASSDWYQSEDKIREKVKKSQVVFFQRTCQVAFFEGICQTKAVKMKSQLEFRRICQVAFYFRNCQKAFKVRNCQKYENTSQFRSLKIVVIISLFKVLSRESPKVVVVEILYSCPENKVIKVPSDINRFKTIYIFALGVSGGQYTRIVEVEVGEGFLGEEGVLVEEVWVEVLMVEAIEVVIKPQQCQVLVVVLGSDLVYKLVYEQHKPVLNQLHDFSSQEWIHSLGQIQMCTYGPTYTRAYVATKTSCCTGSSWSSPRTRLSSSRRQTASMVRKYLNYCLLSQRCGKSHLLCFL